MGRQATDKISGFTGMVTAYAQYITGCNQVCIQAKTGKSSETKSHWFDEQRLTFSGKPLILENGQTPGFGDPAPIR